MCMVCVSKHMCTSVYVCVTMYVVYFVERNHFCGGESQVHCVFTSTQWGGGPDSM